MLMCTRLQWLQEVYTQLALDCDYGLWTALLCFVSRAAIGSKACASGCLPAKLYSIYLGVPNAFDVVWLLI